jgi:hypothetical protein
MADRRPIAMSLLSKSFFGALAISVVFFAGCKSAPMHQPAGVIIPASGKTVSMDDVQKAMIRGGTRAGWQLIPEGPGRLSASYISGNHNATVDIEYDAKAYTIKHRSSTLQRAEGGAVHRLYNTWVQNLDRSIRAELAQFTY